MHFQNVARLVVAGDGAARFHRHAGVTADGKLKRNNRMRVAEGGVDVAVAFANHTRFGGQFMLADARLLGREHGCSERFDVDLNQIRGVFGDISIDTKHYRDRFADIADDILRQHRLAVGLQRFKSGEAERDRRNVSDVCGRPHRMHAGQFERGRRIDRFDFAVRDGRTHHSHAPLAGKRNVGGKAPLAQEQRAVFQARDGAADEFGRGGHFARIAWAAARTALMMF